MKTENWKMELNLDFAFLIPRIITQIGAPYSVKLILGDPIVREGVRDCVKLIIIDVVLVNVFHYEISFLRLFLKKKR